MTERELDLRPSSPLNKTKPTASRFLLAKLSIFAVLTRDNAMSSILELILMNGLCKSKCFK